MYLNCPFSKNKKCPFSLVLDGSENYREDIDEKRLYCGFTKRGKDIYGNETNKISEMVGCIRFKENQYRKRKRK